MEDLLLLPLGEGLLDGRIPKSGRGKSVQYCSPMTGSLSSPKSVTLAERIVTTRKRVGWGRVVAQFESGFLDAVLRSKRKITFRPPAWGVIFTTRDPSWYFTSKNFLASLIVQAWMS